jgi:hypothetical protein
MMPATRYSSETHPDAPTLESVYLTIFDREVLLWLKGRRNAALLRRVEEFVEDLGWGFHLSVLWRAAVSVAAIAARSSALL